MNKIGHDLLVGTMTAVFMLPSADTIEQFATAIETIIDLKLDEREGGDKHAIGDDTGTAGGQ